MTSPYLISKNRLRKVVKNFEEAVRGHEMRGSQHPLEDEWYQSNYWIAKTELQLALGIRVLKPALAKKLERAKAQLDDLEPTEQEIEEWDR